MAPQQACSQTMNTTGSGVGAFMYIFLYVYLMLCLHIYIYIYIFENGFFPTTTVQQRQHMDVVECHTVFNGLINCFSLSFFSPQITTWSQVGFVGLVE